MSAPVYIDGVEDANWIPELQRSKGRPVPVPPSTTVQARAALRGMLAYDPNQPRDQKGRWGRGGFGGGRGGVVAEETVDYGRLAAPNDMGDFSPEAQAKFMARAKELGKGFPQTPEAMAEVTLATYRRATPEQLAAGMRWYQDAHDGARAEAAKYASSPNPITDDQAYGVLAVCSPRTRWEKNQQQFKAILKVHAEDKPFEIDAATLADLRGPKLPRGPGTYRPSELTGSQLTFAHPDIKAVRNQPFGDNAEKAFRILRGESPDTVVSGPKVRNFYNNIRNPQDDQSVTIDTWAVRAQVKAGVRLPVPTYQKQPDGSIKKVDFTMSEDASTQTYFPKPKGLKVGIENGTGMYPFFGTATQLAAKEVGILPQQMQAITWLVVKAATEGGDDD